MQVGSANAALLRCSGVISRWGGALLSPAGHQARLAVFSYHQVLESRDSLRPGEPDSAEFADDVRRISSTFSVLPLREAAERLLAGSLPARAACLTFDDGYANNFELAAPILESAGIPATFFIAGGAVDSGVMWNDLIIEAVARRGPAPFDSVGLIDSKGLEGSKLANQVIQQLKYEPVAARASLALKVFRSNTDGDVPPRLMMTRQMIANLASRGFEIGGHTINHPILARMPDNEARSEIQASSRWIADVTGQVPTSFAYPNGRPEIDFEHRHEGMVADAGYRLAVSTEWGVARHGTGLYRIPRVGSWWRQGRALPVGMLRLYLRSYLKSS